MKTEEIKQEVEKWNERHFQVCLALISRPNVDCYGTTKPLSFQDIITKADRMISLLQQREEKTLIDYIKGQEHHNNHLD